MAVEGPVTAEHPRFPVRFRWYALASCLAWTVALVTVTRWVLTDQHVFSRHTWMVCSFTSWLLGCLAIGGGMVWLRQRQRNLEAREALYRSLWEQSRDGLFLIRDHKFVACNRVAEQLLGREREGIIGASPWELSPVTQPDGRDSREAALDRLEAAMEGDPKLFEWRHSRPDGSGIDVEVWLSRVEVGSDVFILAALRDIGARRRSEERRRLLERAVEQAAENILVTDTDGTILYVNPAFEKNTGYSFDEIIGRHPSILVSGQHDREFFEELWNTISSGRVWRGTMVNRRKNGELYHEEIVISPVVDDHGTIMAYVSVGRDITRELELERRMQLAERMETVGQMAGVVAHDFNNLLMAVQGAAHVIAMRVGDDPRLRDRIGAIQRAVEKGADLIQRLLTVSKRQVSDPQDLELGRLLTEMRPTVEAALREDIGLELVMPEKRVVVRVDPGQFERIVLNLVANARDAMPQGGHLLLELDVVVMDASAVAAKPWTKEGRFARLSVSDTGVGMDVATIARIFEPFFTTKDERGTGLGLSTVYGLVDQAGGFINVYSEQGKGSVFKVYLPIVEGEPNLGEAAPRDSTMGIPTGTETVLLVEDDEGVREGIRDMLVELGYSVIDVGDGDQALQVLEERPLAVDVVLTDIVIPGIDGGELAERARTIAPHARFVFSSGYTENVIHDRFARLPNMAYLEKPFTFAQLGRTIREVLDSRP